MNSPHFIVLLSNIYPSIGAHYNHQVQLDPLPHEVAEMLMVGKNRVYELLNKEELKGMRIGKSTWRIPKEAVLQFIREQSRL